MTAAARTTATREPTRPRGRRQSYDRARLLAQANEARRKRKRKKAIELYRSVLRHEPENPELHRRVAQLLAERRQRKEALTHFARAVDGLSGQGFLEKAAGLCRQAAGFYPDDAGIWETLAGLQLRREKRADAVAALLEGRRRMRGRRRRPQAIRLLQRVQTIEPLAVEPQIDLAWLLRADGQRRQACRLLDELAARTAGRSRSRARLARLRIAPGPGPLWRWLAALLGR